MVGIVLTYLGFDCSNDCQSLSVLLGLADGLA